MTSYQENKPVLELKAISKSFGQIKVLAKLNLELYQGEIVSLLGSSGSGKTTIFNIIAGLLEPDQGQVKLRGKEITGETGYVSYMLQKDLLLDHLYLIDNVALPLLIKGIKKQEARKIVKEQLDDFGLKGFEYKYPGQLSGGMAQRAALLRTYLFSRDLALFDEPFSALDAITKDKLHRWYLDLLPKLKMSSLFITHDINEAIKLSDRILILDPKTHNFSAEIKIKEEDKRQVDLFLKPEFLKYKQEVLSHLA